MSFWKNLLNSSRDITGEGAAPCQTVHFGMCYGGQGRGGGKGGEHQRNTRGTTSGGGTMNNFGGTSGAFIVRTAFSILAFKLFENSQCQGWLFYDMLGNAACCLLSHQLCCWAVHLLFLRWTSIHDDPASLDIRPPKSQVGHCYFLINTNINVKNPPGEVKP